MDRRDDRTDRQGDDRFAKRDSDRFEGRAAAPLDAALESQLDAPLDAPLESQFDDPGDVAAAAAMVARPLLVALDVDGVLAPLADRPDQSMLVDGVHGSLALLAACTPVAVVSGRSLDDLERRFGFPAGVTVVGSHGLERRGARGLTLDETERRRLEQLDALARSAAIDAGDGAMVERKPASVVLHVRLADSVAAGRATTWLTDAASTVEGATVKPGHAVVELFARATSKADAVAAARVAVGAATVLFAGDDHTDEEVLAHLGRDDIGVRVGTGSTLARWRLGTPQHVADLLARLCVTLG